MSSDTVCDINATVRAVQKVPAYWELLNLTFWCRPLWSQEDRKSIVTLKDNVNSQKEEAWDKGNPEFWKLILGFWLPEGRRNSDIFKMWIGFLDCKCVCVCLHKYIFIFMYAFKMLLFCTLIINGMWKLHLRKCVWECKWLFQRQKNSCPNVSARKLGRVDGAGRRCVYQSSPHSRH